jgi:protein-L-isoaspartate(D-aspartate) O-methyltransferase
MLRRVRIARVVLAVVALGVVALGARAALQCGAASPGAAPAEPERPADWKRPRFTERERERYAMVRRSIEPHRVAGSAVLDALRHVPRHEFVRPRDSRRAYHDTALPIGHGQTISQPYVVAYMTEQLKLKPGDKVLEIGTGSGYQAAVLSEITPEVFTVEIVAPLGREARERLTRLGYGTIRCKIADGYHGWAEHAPFDAIIVTCASGNVPPPLIRQLKPGGRMCIPVGPPGSVQHLVLVTKDADGKPRSRILIPVRFVPLTRGDR